MNDDPSVTVRKLLIERQGVPEGKVMPDARILHDLGVKVFDRASSSKIKTALSAGETGHCVICVEDLFAQSLLREILRRYDPNLLESVAILPFGDFKAVKSAKSAITDAGRNVIAVLDGDQSPAEAQNVYCLPGQLPPEKEVFH